VAEPRPRWLYLIVAGYLVLALGMSAALFRSAQQGRKVQSQADRIESLVEQDCTRRQEARVAVRSIGLTLRTLVTSTSGNSLDLTAVPGYLSLDPSVREFFATLSTPSGPSDWQVSALMTVDDALGKLPELTCP
jgi:hypothetical protein